MATIQNRKILLVSVLEEKTGLINLKDFKMIKVVHKTVNRPNPSEFIILNFIGGDIDSKKRLTMRALEILQIDHDEIRGRLYVKLPDLTPALLSLNSVKEKEIKSVQEFDSYKRRFIFLSKIHLDLSLLGTKNKDQPDLGKGLAYFNYFDSDETDRAHKIFTNLGLALEVRKEKPCNLTFLLDSDFVDVSKVPSSKIDWNGKTVNVCLWILKKIHRKTIENIPKDRTFGVSEPVRINCGQVEMISIKKELAEKYGIEIMINNGNTKTSEFFVLTSEPAKEIYHSHNGQISPCDLIKQLNSTTETNTNTNTETMKEKKKMLPAVVREKLRAEGFTFLEKVTDKEKESCLQIRHEDENKIKISFHYGSGAKRQALSKKVEMVIMDAYPKASIIKGRTGITLTISIPGYLNPPSKKRRKEEKTATENEKISESVGQPVKARRKYVRKIAVLPENTNTISEEDELRAILDNPILRAALNPETLKRAEGYFQKKDIEKRAQDLLKKLGG